MIKLIKVTGNKTSFISDVVSLLKDGGVVFLLFCIVMYTVLYPYHVYIKLVFCIVALGLCNRKIYFDMTTFWLGTFSVLYTLFIFLLGKTTSYAELGSYLIGPISFYLFGQYIVDKSKTQMRISSFILITLILFGSNAYVITMKDAQTYGIINISREMTVGGLENILSATLFGANVSLGLVGIGAFMAISKPFSSLKAWLYLSISILSTYTVLHLINRTGIVVLVVCLLVVVFYLSRKYFFRVLIALGLLSMLVYLLIYSGIISQEYFDAYTLRESDLSNSIGYEGGRLFRWKDALGKLFVNPYGWDTNSYKYVHNMWLDVAHSTGFLPFIPLVIATTRSTKVALKLFAIENNESIAIIIGLNVCFFLTLFVEPIIEGMSTYFYLYCMIWGIQQKYYRFYFRCK